jgi:hypothetical protein
VISSLVNTSRTSISLETVFQTLLVDTKQDSISLGTGCH